MGENCKTWTYIICGSLQNVQEDIVNRVTLDHTRTLILALRLEVTCPKGHLCEIELCRFRNLMLNLTITLTLTNPNPMPIHFGQITLRASELSPTLNLTLTLNSITNHIWCDPVESVSLYVLQ